MARYSPLASNGHESALAERDLPGVANQDWQSPLMRLRRLVLPAPSGPMKARISPHLEVYFREGGDAAEAKTEVGDTELLHAESLTDRPGICKNGGKTGW